MTTERWKKVEAVFEQALELAPDQRPTFLQGSCDGDQELRREVQSLLDSHARAGTFIDHPGLFITSDESERDDVVATGQLIGSYRVVRELGRGGMGAVYLAERADEQYQKRVAIKLIKRGMDTDAVLRRFRNERQILASFDHANIARLFDAGTTATGLPYFVMEYVEGVSIDKYCDKHALSVPDRLKLFREVCAAVAYAHGCGVIHRDIKASNIVITAEGAPKLVDFGIAKILQPADGAETLLTTADLRPMTPQYASPEQVRGEALTPATDIYSLGIVLYELLTGQLPYRFVSQSPHDVARAITEQEPTRPSTAVAVAAAVSAAKPTHAGDTPATTERVASDQIPKPQIPNPKLLRGDLDNIVLKALRKEPEQRYHSVEQLSEDIRRHLEGSPIIARPLRAPARLWRWSRRNPVLAGAVTACLVLVLAVAWLMREQFLAPKIPAPEKSIAVLPFENLSRDPDNAFFTDGVQDEILTSLSRVVDLKVISRTSVMQYKDATKRNLREIGRQLGVAHVLEGSVQRAANRVRVNAQLINVRNDAHLWARTYDGDLTDVFAIQSRIAQAIAEQLEAQMSAQEKAAIARAPTTDIVADALYRQALGLEHQPPEDQTLRHAVQMLEEAVKRDPKFALAYCALSQRHMSLYFGGYDHTATRREQAKVALQKAAQIQPDAGEVHLAAAEYWFHGFFDYDRARAEIELARRSLPNNVQVYVMAAAMDRRQARWSEAITNFERAAELDPRDLESVMNTAATYEGLHRYSDATRMYKRAAALPFDDYLPRIAARSFQALRQQGDIRPLRAELNAILAEDPNAAPKIADHLWLCAILERDRAAIERALATIPGEGLFAEGNFIRPREWYIGYVARMFDDAQTARTAFSAARSKLEKLVQEQPDYAPAWALLGRVDAALGRKEEAVREGRHACELLPLSKDAWFGPDYLRSLGKIYVWTGEKELALAQLEQLAALEVAPLDYGDLKLDPDWDPLRGDARFERLVASLAPK